MGQHVDRINKLAAERELGIVWWGGSHYNSDYVWKVELTVRKSGDKFELKAEGETMEEAAETILAKYDTVVMGVPMMAPRAMLAHDKAEPAF